MHTRTRYHLRPHRDTEGRIFWAYRAEERREPGNLAIALWSVLGASTIVLAGTVALDAIARLF